MDIQQYIALDKKLLLNLNGSNSLFWDGFMWVATSTYIWIPTAIILLYIIIKNNKIQETLLTIAMIALVITLADQIASGVCKPYFHRFRPTQDPDIMYIVDIVNGYRGGRFGFIIFRFCRRSFYLFSFVFSLSGASLPLTLPHLLFFSTNYKNTHVCEEKRPGSAASASEVFLRSLPFFILPFFAFPLLLSILFPIFVR